MAEVTLSDLAPDYLIDYYHSHGLLSLLSIPFLLIEACTKHVAPLCLSKSRQLPLLFLPFLLLLFVDSVDFCVCSLFHTRCPFFFCLIIMSHR